MSPSYLLGHPDLLPHTPLGWSVIFLNPKWLLGGSSDWSRGPRPSSLLGQRQMWTDPVSLSPLPKWPLPMGTGKKM